jgi:hypothetical protein
MCDPIQGIYSIIVERNQTHLTNEYPITINEYMNMYMLIHIHIYRY